MRRMHDDKEVVSKVGFDSTTNKLTVEQANGDKKTYTIAGGGSGVDPESLLANMEGSDYIELGIDESEDKLQVEVTNIETAEAVENSTKLITSGAVFADLAGKADVEDIPTKVSDLDNDSDFSAVSGTNDGTNWTSITIDGTTKSIPQGGGGASYTAGDGIDITNNEISVDSTVAKVADIPTAVSDLQNDENFSSVSGTNDGTNWQSITIDGTTKNIPAAGPTYTAGDGIDITNGQISADNTIARVSAITQLDFSEDKVQGGYNLGSITVGNDSWNIPNIPTKTSDLTNDSGFITSSALSPYRTSSAQDVIDATKANTADLAAVATSGDYDDLSDKPDLSIYAESANLATVATSGSYNDLTNKPTYATVATTGDYDDLTDKPTLGALAAKNTVDYATEVTNKPTLGTLAAKNSVDYTTEVTNKPTLGALASKDSVNYSTEVTNKPDLSVYALSSSLATVATSGDYDDLLNKPTIPSALSAGNGITISNDEVSTNAREIVGQDAFDEEIITGEEVGEEVNSVTIVSNALIDSIGTGHVILGYQGVDSLDEPIEMGADFVFTSAMQETIENSGTVTINADTENGTFTIQNDVEPDTYLITANPTTTPASSIQTAVTGYRTETTSIETRINNNTSGIEQLYTTLSDKLDASMCTYQTTAPTEAIADGGVHIVFLSAEPATKYNGYIYLIAEA